MTVAFSGADQIFDRGRTAAELHGCLDTWMATPALENLVQPLLDPDVDVGELAALSYRHDNGFDKLALRALRTGQKLVLHAWWPTEEALWSDANLHDHRWHFATAVLAGSYTYFEFEEAPADHHLGTLVHRHRYEVPWSGADYRLLYEGPRRLVTTGFGQPQAGCRYVLDCRVIHRVELDSRDPTITLFLQGPPVRSGTRVYSPQPLAGNNEITVRRFTPDQYRTRLRAALSVISMG